MRYNFFLLSALFFFFSHLHSVMMWIDERSFSKITFQIEERNPVFTPDILSRLVKTSYEVIKVSFDMRVLIRLIRIAAHFRTDEIICNCKILMHYWELSIYFWRIISLLRNLRIPTTQDQNCKSFEKGYMRRKFKLRNCWSVQSFQWAFTFELSSVSRRWFLWMKMQSSSLIR